jgi:hypothetical protein
MRPLDILKHVRRQPFEPFRVYVYDGASYVVPHPEMITVSRTDVAIAVANGNDEVPEELVWFDPIHITWIGPARSRKGAGRRKRRRS